MPTTADVLRAGGIVANIDDVLAASQASGLPLHLLAPKLMKESYGGRNVIGNDRVDDGGQYRKGGDAGDRAMCERYLRWRGPAGQHRNRQQGWGPSQLTWAETQDEAERRGGLHIPRVNMTVGAEALARLLTTTKGDVRDAGTRYNGGRGYADPKASEQSKAYGRWLASATEDWRRRLTGTTGPASAIASTGGGCQFGAVADPATTNWQTWLRDNFKGYAGGLLVDGDFGEATRRATAEFQKRSGITGADADGRTVGPRTLTAARSLGYRG